MKMILLILRPSWARRAAALGFSWALIGWPAQTSFGADPAVSALEIPKSVFEDRPEDPGSRDPFYPNSARRRPPPQPPTEGGKPPGPVIPPKPRTLADHLKLEAIINTARGAIAIINEQRFSEGQTRQVYAPPNLTLRVRCLEIGPKTAKVLVGDETEPQVLSLP